MRSRTSLESFMITSSLLLFKQVDPAGMEFARLSSAWAEAVAAVDIELCEWSLSLAAAYPAFFAADYCYLDNVSGSGTDLPPQN